MGSRCATTASVSAGLNSPHRMAPHSASTSSLVIPVHSWYIVRRFVASGRSGLSNSIPSIASVLHRLIFFAISSGVSRTLMRDPSAGLDLDIFAVPSVSDRPRASLGNVRLGNLQNLPPAEPTARRAHHPWDPSSPLAVQVVHARSAMSRVSSRCCRWSSPTGTTSALYSRMSAAMSTG